MMGFRDKIANKLLRFAQNRVTKAYEKEGLTDDVLEAQLRVNNIRNKYDLNETDDEFVQ